MKTEETLTAPVDAVVRLPRDERLDALRYCIVHGSDEDAQNHIFDLLRGLRCKDKPDEQLTGSERRLKSEWAADGSDVEAIAGEGDALSRFTWLEAARFVPDADGGHIEFAGKVFRVDKSV